MLVIADFTANEVLPLVGEGQKHTFTIKGVSYAVNLNSPRLQLFQRQQHCVACNILGNVMRLEREKPTDVPHFNLYAKDGPVFVLMTKDHIKPVSLGGTDAPENYQTMCRPCNLMKGKYTLTPKQVKQLRDYKKDIGKTPKKQLALLVMERIKEMLSDKPHIHVGATKKTRGIVLAHRKSLAPSLLTSSALNIIRKDNNELHALSVHQETDREIVDVMPAGAAATPLGSDGAYVLIKLPYSRYCYVHHGQLKLHTDVTKLDDIVEDVD